MNPATRVVSALAAARKATQLYPASHPRFEAAITELVRAVSEREAGRPFVLNLFDGMLYNESYAIDPEVPGASTVAEAFEARSIESLSLLPSFAEADAVGLTQVLGIRPSPSLDIERELAARGVSGVSIALLERSDEDREKEEEETRTRAQDERLMRELADALRSIRERLAKGEVPEIDEADRLVSGAMRRVVEDQAAMLGMATLRASREADLHHGLNVMVYALVLGTALGFSDKELTSLGISALLHDIGKASADLAGPEEQCHDRHPSVGADMLCRLPLDDPAPLLVAYEHHMGSDGSGFPERQPDYAIHPFSRIVAIANRYENLTKPDDAGLMLTPDRAMASLVQEARSALDPTLTRLFVGTVGVFPVGCVVRLTDMRVGVVCGSGNGALRPRVKLLYDADGTKLDETLEVEANSGATYIAEVIDPDDFGLVVSEAL